jgi:hypothetical protein
MVDPLCFGFFLCRDLDVFHPPLVGASLLQVTDPLLPPGGITILEAGSYDHAAATTNEHDCSLEEAATPDPYFYFCVTL